MPLIILNTANNTSSMATAADKEIVESLSDYMAAKQLDIKVRYTTSFDQLKKQLEAANTQVLVISNCPPNSTFKQGKPKEMYTGGYTVLTSFADGYDVSKELLKELSANYPSSNYVIITGASEQSISDAELRQLSPAGRIKVKRKRDFMQSGEDYVPAFTGYALGEVDQWFKKINAAEQAKTIEPKEVKKLRQQLVTSQATLAPRIAANFRVFISSTFEDMLEERNALEQVFTNVQQFCRQQGVRFQVIDLRWGVSESAARDQQTMKICLDEIQRCQATSSGLNFVALLGDRYGWRPLPAHIPAAHMDRFRELVSTKEWAQLSTAYQLDENAIAPQYALCPVSKESEHEWPALERKLHRILAKAADRNWQVDDPRRVPYECSAVHQEIWQGVLGLSRNKVRARAYLRKAKASSDTKDGRERLAQLKDRLKSFLGPQRVHEYAIRRKNKATAAKDLQSFCNQVEQDLLKAVRQTLKRAAPIDELEHEIREHQAFAKERREHFRGRKDLCGLALEYISATNPRPWLLYGPSGSGKSAFMSRIFASAAKKFPNDVIVWRSIGATPASSSPRLLLEGLCRETARAFAMPEPDLSLDDWQLVRQFWLILHSATADKRVVLFLDALDQLNIEGQLEPLDWLPLELPDHVRLILSVADDEAKESTANPIRNALAPENCQALDSLTAVDALELLQVWLQHAGRTLTEEQFKLVQTGIHHCRLPLYLRLLFEQCRLWHSYDSAPKPNITIDAMVLDFLKGLEKKSAHGRTLVRHSLKYLAAARYGLSEDELLALLSDDKQVLNAFAKMPESPEVDRLPFVVWSRLRYDLAPYLTTYLQTKGATALLGFYHRVVAQAIHQHLFAKESKTKIHRVLAEFFAQGTPALEQPNYYLDALGRMTPNRRKCSELPYQQTQATTWKALEQTLSDLEFIQVKCASGMVFDLVDDLQRGIAALAAASGKEQKRRNALELIARFVQRQSRNFLRWATIPGFVAQQAWNKPRNIPEPLPLRFSSGSSQLQQELKQELQQKLQQETLWLRSINPENDPLIAVLDEFADAVTECSLSVDDQVLIAASRDGSVRRFKLPEWTTLSRITGREQAMLGCDISPDGTRVVSACEDGFIRIHHLLTRQTTVCEGKFDEPSRCRFLPDSNIAVSSCRKGFMLHDANDGKLLQHKGKDTYYVDLDIAADGTIALAGYDGIHVLAPDHKKRLRKLGGGDLFTCSYSSDGRYLLAGGGQEIYVMGAHPYGETALWDTKDWTEVEAHNVRYSKPITACAFLPDGLHYVIGSNDGYLRFIELATGNVVRTVGAHSDAIRSVRCSSQGLLLSAGYDGRLKAWSIGALFADESEYPGRALFGDVDSGGLQATVWTAKTSGFQCAFQRHDYNLGLLQFRKDATQDVQPDSDFMDVPMARHHMDVISPKTVALLDYEGSWNAPHRTSPITFKQHNTAESLVLYNYYLLIAWSARLLPFDFYLLPPIPSELYSGENLTWAVAVRERKIAVLRRDSLGIYREFENKQWQGVSVDFTKPSDHLLTVPQCAFSQDSRFIYFTWNNRLYVANVENNSITAQKQIDDKVITAFCESPDGQRLVLCGSEGSLLSWKIGAESIQSYQGHREEVVDCAWLNDMKIVSIGSDATIRLWEVGQPEARALYVADNELSTLAVSSRRERIVAADIHGRLTVLEADRGFTSAVEKQPKESLDDFVQSKLLLRLKQCVAHNPHIQTVAELVFLNTKGQPKSTWYAVMDAGEVAIQKNQTSRLDLTLEATLKNWSKALVSELGADNLFGDSPLIRGAGDLAKLAQLAAAWNETLQIDENAIA